jgi:hypothetical protein
MFNKYNKTRTEIESSNDREYEALAQRAAMLNIQSFEFLIEKAIRKFLRPVTDELMFLKTHLSKLTAKQQDIMDQMGTRLMPISGQLTEINTRLQQIIYSVERVEKQQEQLNAQGQLLDNASRERQILTEEHYQDHIIQPMVRSLFSILDFVNDVRNGSTGHSNNGEMCTEELADSVLVQLCQFLSAYEIELIQHKADAKFDPRQMRPVKKIPTDDKRLDNRVAKSLRTGFRGKQQQRLLRPESVVLYEYRETKSTNTVKERDQNGTGN